MDIFYQRARAAERAGNWQEAKDNWLIIGNKEEVAACDLIIRATEDGNAFRQRVKETIGDAPDQSENPRAWLKWHEELNKIY